jgi:hypothetical protein
LNSSTKGVLQLCRAAVLQFNYLTATQQNGKTAARKETAALQYCSTGFSLVTAAQQHCSTAKRHEPSSQKPFSNSLAD